MDESLRRDASPDGEPVSQTGLSPVILANSYSITINLTTDPSVPR